MLSSDGISLYYKNPRHHLYFFLYECTHLFFYFVDDFLSACLPTFTIALISSK